MKKYLNRWLLKKWFSVTISDSTIDQEFIMHLSREHISSSPRKWKNVYLFEKLRYCSFRYREIYGETKAHEFGTEIIKGLDIEIEKSKRRIDEAMKKFLKD